MKNKLVLNHVKLSTIIFIMIITAIVSGITSGIIVYSSYGKNTGISYKTINNDNSLKEFLEVYNQITTEYYENVNKSELIEAAISSMLDYLDDNYTTLMDSNQTNLLNESLKGEYKGIGVYIQEDHKIAEVFDDSPAKAAGILVNDEIVKVNNEDVTNKTSSEIASSIKGSNEEEVLISVKRNNEVIDLTVQLSKLYVPAISTEVIENTSIGYLRLATFSSTVSKQVENALEKFGEQNITSLIIDLRSNGGGFLSAAEDVSNIFLEKGKVVYFLKSKNETKEIKDVTSSKTDYKIVVLIDENTASAAEILTAALKDSYGATIVGKKSFGKGKVQQTFRLSNGSMAKYTSAKWLRPNGECIDGVGITPDYEVELQYEKDKKGNIIDIIDSQLNKAVELLS
ncbi:MAG: S41 family peptidase [Bacilli bacterium]|nr:S41 family peptidase [Bacilli bacterium]